MSAETTKLNPQVNADAAPEDSGFGNPDAEEAAFVPAATVDFAAPASAVQPQGEGDADPAPENDTTTDSADITELKSDWQEAAQSEPWPRSEEPALSPPAFEPAPETEAADNANGGGNGPGQPPSARTGGHFPEPASEPDEKTDDGDNDDGTHKPMTLMDHLTELRVRLVRCLLGSAVGFLLCYGVSELLFKWLAMPLVAVMPQDAKLMFTSVPEGFFVYLKVAFVAGLFVASPYLFYQVWAFVAPGLYQEEKRTALPLAFCSAFFFILGAGFCYFVVFPYAFTFFMSYSNDFIVAMPSINEYLSFSLKMLLAFGLIFEMPLFAFFLARMGIITATWMRSIRRYAILSVFIVAAILTPPDVISQLLMAIPMLILYEVSIFVAQGAGRTKKTADTAAPGGNAA